MRRKLLVICILLASCTSSRMVETSLYFGQSKPGGGMVTATEWQRFKEDYVMKVFKEGSTVINVSGNWYDTAARKLITEPTFVMIYYYKRSPAVSKQIDSLRQWYKDLFQQQSVLRVDKKVAASF
ncbi:MAG: DUF3574 domain-containing protein [Chitinophagaceae bacterium]